VRAVKTCEAFSPSPDATNTRKVIARKTFENAKPVDSVVNLMKPDKEYMARPPHDLGTFLGNMKRHIDPDSLARAGAL
jgi:hypothetical protein